jgi:hypothetical protein
MGNDIWRESVAFVSVDGPILAISSRETTPHPVAKGIPQVIYAPIEAFFDRSWVMDNISRLN